MCGNYQLMPSLTTGSATRVREKLPESAANTITADAEQQAVQQGCNDCQNQSTSTT